MARLASVFALSLLAATTVAGWGFVTKATIDAQTRLDAANVLLQTNHPEAVSSEALDSAARLLIDAAAHGIPRQAVTDTAVRRLSEVLEQLRSRGQVERSRKLTAAALARLDRPLAALRPHYGQREQWLSIAAEPAGGAGE